MPSYFAPGTGFRKPIDIDQQQKAHGVVRDGAPSRGQEAAVGHARLGLDCGPKPACRKAVFHDRPP